MSRGGRTEAGYRHPGLSYPPFQGNRLEAMPRIESRWHFLLHSAIITLTLLVPGRQE
jgi:hypothetical protein